MIKSIQIKNFKSVVDLSLDLGTFNVLIGENGSGKSNILEAIAFGAAASADKLDFEFLGSRGIRVTNPEFMFSAFSNGKKEKVIRLDFKTDNEDHFFELINDVNNKKKWIEKNLENLRGQAYQTFEMINQQKNQIESLKQMASTGIAKIKELDALDERLQKIENVSVQKEKDKLSELIENVRGRKVKLTEKLNVGIPELDQRISKIENELRTFYEALDHASLRSGISSYIIYSPEQSSLRKLEETTQIYPLGIKGEGLFQYLKELALDKKSKKTLNDIRHNLVLLDWYEDFDLPDNLMKNEFSLKIKDKYLLENLQYFDQRSTNEGFLFLLFYSTLFISRTTPAFFAIDNIDASFNPKLCMQLTKNLTALGKKHKKQVIVTTQNPAILDGLNLKDDNQRLFVVRRNDQGHTKAKRIEFKSERKLKLSEVWTNGFIGGLPENF